MLPLARKESLPPSATAQNADATRIWICRPSGNYAIFPSTVTVIYFPKRPRIQNCFNDTVVLHWSFILKMGPLPLYFDQQVPFINTRRRLARIALLVYSLTWFYRCRTLKLHWTPPMTGCWRQPGTTTVTIYRYQPRKLRIRTRETHGPARWQALLQEGALKSGASSFRKPSSREWLFDCTEGEVRRKRISCKGDGNNGTRSTEWSSTLAASKRAKWSPISRIHRCLEGNVGHLVRKLVIGETLDAHVAKNFDTEAAVDGLSNRLLTPSSLLAPITAFIRRKINTTMENKKYSVTYTSKELKDIAELYYDESEPQPSYLKSGSERPFRRKSSKRHSGHSRKKQKTKMETGFV